MTNNDYQDYEQLDTPQQYVNTFSQSAFATLMRKVYLWMALALAVTGLTAYYVASNFNALTFMSGGSFWGLAIAEIVLVMIISGFIERLSFATAGLLFVAYSVLNGLTLSFIFAVYTHSSIATAFFVTAGTFGVTSLYGYITKKNLSGVGRYLFMALIGLIIASLVNMFLANSTIYWITSFAGVIIFVGLTAWDTQKIKEMFLVAGGEVNDQTQKLALLGSLTLYLDFINLFLYLLRFFGKSND
jgi:FtsH-binding integral membrane protein